MTTISAAAAAPRASITRRAMAGGVAIVLAAIIFVLVIAPLLNVFDIAFHAESDLGLADERSIKAVIAVYATLEYVVPLLHTIVLAVLVTALALVVGVTLAVIVARTDIPFKPLWDILILIPLFLSPFTLLIAWITLAGPRTGFLNGIWQAILSPFMTRPADIVNLNSYTGIVWLLFLISCPLAYLFVIGTLRAMDASLEEASRSAGATPLRTIISITLPVCLPSILSAGLLIFVLTMETYTIPGVIGGTIGFTTLPWKMFEDTTSVPPRLAHAAAAGTMLLFITCAGVWLQRRITRFSNRYVTISGKGIRARPFHLGRWRPWLVGLLTAYAAATVMLPMIGLVVSSFLRFSAAIPTLNIMTTRHFVQIFTERASSAALPNTVKLAVASAVLCVVIGLLVSVLDVRRPRWWTKTLSVVGIMPIAVSGLIFGFGLLWAYIRTPLYGTMWILLLAYVARFLPYGIVMSRSALIQVDPALEESARMSGAGNLRILGTITLPLIKPSLIAILFLVMMQTVKEISASILLFTPQSQVLSTLAWQYVQAGGFQFAAAVGVVQTVMLIVLILATRFVFGLRLERTLGKEAA
jgi:iron(III) transport system permease protein